MNAERLLEHYDRIADAPDAIGRLRRFILDLAVRGKLMPQDAKDESASELLMRIAKGKALLITSRHARHDELEPVTGDQEPFSIPANWKWTRLGNVADLVRGVSFPASEKSTMAGPDLLPCFRSGNIQAETVWGDFIFVPRRVLKGDQQLLRDGDILISIANSYELVGKCSIVKSVREQATFGAFLAAIRLYVLVSEYIRYVLSSDYSSSRFRLSSAQTTNIANITFATIRDHTVPLPPLAEQHRIVAKIDELMALCDRVEAARAEREMTRDRLTAASLARLNAPDPESFQDDARFVLNALPALTTRRDQIKQLRQTILNLAVHGKLVPQNPHDEPIVVTMRGIQADVEGLSLAGEAADETNAGFRYDIPRGWAWLAARRIADFVDPQPSHRTPPEHQDGVPYVGYGDITQSGTLNLENARKVSRTVLEEHRERYALKHGDFVIGKIGTIGDPVLLPSPFDYTLSANLILVQPRTKIVSPSYLMAFIGSPIAESTLRARKTDSTHAVFGIKKARELQIPVPPLAEQNAIIARVQELMTLCDRLEASIAAGDDTRRRLLDALLAEALAPGESREMEAVA